MKKSTIALAVVAGVAIITTGGAWFTGSQIERRYPELLTNANHNLKSLAAYGVNNAQIKDVQLDKGLFSSNVTYTLEAELGDKTYLFKGNDKIFHGPLPLNRLSKGNLVPVLLSAENYVTAEDETIKTAFANKNVVEGTTSISYAGEIESNSTLNPIKFVDSDTELTTSAIYFTGDLSGFGKQNVHIDSLKLVSTKQKGLFELTGFDYDAHFKKDSTFSNITGIGPYSASVKNVKFITDQQQTVTINNLTTQGNSHIQNARLIGNGDFSSNMTLAVNNQVVDLGKFNLDLSMDFDAKGLNDFYRLINKLDTQDPEEIRQIQAASEAMITNGLTFKLTDLSIENSKGKNSLNTTIDLNKFNMAELAQAKTISENFKIFKPSHFNVTLNLAATEEAIKQWMTISPDAQGGNPEEQAKRAMADLINSVKHSEVAVVTEQEIKLNLEIKENKLFLNGTEVPEEQLQMMMFMIMMGTSGK